MQRVAPSPTATAIRSSQTPSVRSAVRSQVRAFRASVTRLRAVPGCSPLLCCRFHSVHSRSPSRVLSLCHQARVESLLSSGIGISLQDRNAQVGTCHNNLVPIRVREYHSPRRYGDLWSRSIWPGNLHSFACVDELGNDLCSVLLNCLVDGNNDILILGPKIQSLNVMVGIGRG